MKLIRKSRLRYTEGTSDKVYEVDLCETPDSGDERFVVNFRFGRFGTKYREGTKTSFPVTQDKAQKIFDSLVVSKMNKGYKETGKGSPALQTVPESEPPASDNSAIQPFLGLMDAPPDDWPLSRIIWRAGELKLHDAADKIAGFAVTGDEHMDYSMAWALGRCGNESHINALENLEKNGTHTVKRIAFEAILNIGPETHKNLRFERLKKGLSKELRQCIENDNADELTDRLMAGLSSQSKHNIPLLETIYSLALRYPCCHVAMANVLKLIPFKQRNYFKAFRHIFKLSEFRLDSLIFGIIAMRIEQTSPGYWGDPFRGGTRDYLRRRTWRTLRRLGEADDDDYVKMSAGILTTFTDEHGKKPRHVVRTVWNWDSRQTEVVSTTFFDAFSDYLALNHILYQNSRQYQLTTSRKAWCRINDIADTQRVEAFPELWDRHPDEVLNLLLKSRCGIVHQFGVKVLQDNAEFCETISTEIIARLLCSVYEETSAFSLSLARQRYNPEDPDISLITACLSATFMPARQQAIQWIDAQPSLLNRSPDLIAHIIVSPYKDIQDRASAYLDGADFSAREKQVLIEKVIALIRGMGEGSQADDIARIASLLLRHYEKELQQIDLAVIRSLLEHTHSHVQLFGARLLLNLNISAEAVPEDLLAIINRSSNQELQGIGVSLLAKYDDEQLLNKHELLFLYCISDIAPVRAAIRPIIKRVAEYNDGFATFMFNDLISILFTQEKYDGLHADIIILIEASLPAPLKQMDKNLRWRLIHARSKSAQQMGAFSLRDASFDDYSVKQWAGFANCPAQSVRAWAMDAYRSNIDRVKRNAADALRILSSAWDDSREFGINYFRENFTAADWNPTIIIGICDSTKDDVQRFGRELITEFFKEGDGVEYLTKLSQHPGRNVQLFTTNYLSTYASDNIERLKQLQPYFITVLSHVCKGRVAKDRVTMFLLTESLKSEAAAHVAAAIFNRQSVTYSLTDKAVYIESMCAIHAKYPEVPLPIQVKPLPVKPYATNEAVDGI